MSKPKLKICQFCSEQILESADKCKYCNSIQLDKDKLIENLVVLIVLIVSCVLLLPLSGEVIKQFLTHEIGLLSYLAQGFIVVIFCVIIYEFTKTKHFHNHFSKFSVSTLLSKQKDYKRLLKTFVRYIVGIWVCIIVLIISLYSTLPSEADFNKFLKTQSDFLPAQIHKVEEFPDKTSLVLMASAVSKYEVRYYVGAWNRFFLAKTEIINLKK